MVHQPLGWRRISPNCLTTYANLKVWTLDFSETPLTIYVYAVYDTPNLYVEELDFSETSLTT